MGNRAFIYLFLIAVLSFLFTAVSAAALSLRRRRSLRMGAMQWAVLFFCAAFPLITGSSLFQLILYGDCTGGLRVVTALLGREIGGFYIPVSILRTARGIAAFLIVLWIAAGGASLSYGLSSYFNNVHFLTKRSRVCRDPHANTVFEGAAAKAGVKRHVPLRVMDPGLKISPCTCGILSPCVFVGEDFLRDCSDTRLELIFLHELTHVRRHDTLLKLLTLAVTSLYVFLPTSKRIRRAVQEDSEFLCDLDVLKRAGKTLRGEYIAVIIDAAERTLRDNCRNADLLSSVSAEGAFILRRYRNMQEPQKRPVTRYLLPVFACGLLVNLAMMRVVGVPNVGNPGVDIADDLTREALCAYFGLDDPGDLTEAHMASVYSLTYTLSDHRALTDGSMRFTRKCVINEGLYPGEDGYVPYILPEDGEQAEWSILPGVLRADMLCSRLPAEFYTEVRGDPEKSPCSNSTAVLVLRNDLTEEEILRFLTDAGERPEFEPFYLGDRTLDLRDLTLFTGLRNLTISEILTPEGYDLTGETGFAVIYQ